MQILIAPDKFKGSLTALQVARTVEQALREHVPKGRFVIKPVADGGEGTAEALTVATRGRLETVQVNDPLFRPVQATYGISGDGKTAFVEMAQASGLALLKPEERNPMLTSTYGTGELIRHALRQGVKEVILCVGGSATNDAGMGMAAALGYEFLDRSNAPLRPIGQSMQQVCRIRRAKLTPDLSQVRFRVACDVDNPLYGPNGAAQIYGPQKGATPDMVAQLDEGLQTIATVLKEDFGIDEAEKPGSGAAGGIGYGARVFLKASFERGFDLVAGTLHLAGEIRQADLIITGEGSLDEQTLQGKVIAGITKLAQSQQTPIIAFCGQLALSPQQLQELGLQQAIAITPPNIPLSEAMSRAEELLRQAVTDWANIWFGH
jgi:glycerate 2-kinase